MTFAIAAPSPSPSRFIVLVALLQFVYIADFLVPMPLGPDIARALGFPPERLGWLAASYTAAAMAAGMAALRWLDRFGRRRALLVSLALFTAATFATALAHDLATLLVARGLTGLFGGPMVAIGMAMVIDSTEPSRRGAAIGKVMLGFSAAAVAGVPASLELARLTAWNAPFAAVGTLAFLLWLAMARWLPPMAVHRTDGPPVSLRTLLARPAVRVACALQATSQFAAFLVIPAFSTYLLLNVGVPRDRLGSLYLVGGLGAMVSLQLLGRLADRQGPAAAVAVASMAVAAGLVPLLGVPVSGTGLAVMALFVCFMAGNAGRNVALGAATSQVPAPHERAAYMALQNVAQDGGIALASVMASLLLSATPTGALAGMPAVAALSVALTVLLPMALATGRLTTPPPASART